MRTAIATHPKVVCSSLTPAHGQEKGCRRSSVSARSAAISCGGSASGGQGLEGKNRQFFMSDWRASTRGFSRVELMVVAAVIVVIAAIAIPRVREVFRKCPSAGAGGERRTAKAEVRAARLGISGDSGSLGVNC